MVKRVIKHEVNKKKTDDQWARWSQKQKYDAVAVYKMCGSLAATGRQLGIPEDTIRKWHLTDWWKEAETDIATQAQYELKGRLKRLVDKAYEQLLDRVENGDYVYDQKLCKLVRKPVSAKDSNVILTNAIDKQILIEKLQKDDQTAQTNEKIQDRLVKLGEEFMRFARAKEIKPETPQLTEGGDPIEVEVLNDPLVKPQEGV